VPLASLVRENVPEINLLAQAPLDPPAKPAPSSAPAAPSSSPPAPATSTGCSGCTTSGERTARSSLLLTLGALLLGWRRRRPC
jgi:MYXO-CTERM domain-containing protein